jgi:hypothetical protein
MPADVTPGTTALADVTAATSTSIVDVTADPTAAISTNISDITAATKADVTQLI